MRKLLDACARAGTPARARRPAELAAEFADEGARGGTGTPAHAGPDAPAGARRVLVTRLPSGTPLDELCALLPLEDAGARWINRPSRLLRAHDKAASLGALAAAGVPVVPTAVVRRDAPDPDLDRLPGERYVVKPIHGAAGRGVTVGLDAARALRRARAFAELSGPALVQPYVGGGVDRRAFVVGGEIVASMQRTPRASGGRGNAFQGARIEPWRPGEAERDTALASARALGLDVAGVDLLADGRVLEVNACPGLDAIALASGLDVAALLADFVIRTARVR